jgi:hypothetical protein
VNSLESGQHNLVGSFGPPQDFDKNWNYSFELPVLGARGTLHWQDPYFPAYIVLSLLLLVKFKMNFFENKVVLDVLNCQKWEGKKVKLDRIL